jgi:hypothetical protein
MFADDVALIVKSAAEFKVWWESRAASREKSHIMQHHRITINQHASKDRPAILLYRELCYAQHMQRALSLFSSWLAEVGMQANSGKSKVVIFSSAAVRNHHWMSNQSINQRSEWYHNLELDGFTLQLTNQYQYLGLLLDSNMNWSQHIAAVTRKATQASSLICRLFSHQRHSPHPSAALKLVRSLVIPTMTYGIHFWLLTEPSQSTHSDAIDKLHTLIIRPLRIAANLPRTTHRLGVMIDFGLSSLHDYAHQSLIRYYTKYASPVIHQSPEVQQFILSDDTLHSGRPSDHFHPSIIRTIHDAHYKSIINPKPLTQHKKWTTLGSRARYQIIPAFDQTIADARLIPSLQTLSLLISLPQHNAAAQHNVVAQPNTQLNTQHSFDHNHIPLIASLRTFLAWRSQWTSINPTHQT